MDDYEELDDAALAILRLHGPLTDEEWAERLVEHGQGDEEDMLDFIDMFDSPELGFFEDGRTLALGVLLEGRILTHRVTSREIGSDIVDIGNTLTPISALVDGGPTSRGYETVFRQLTPDSVFVARGVMDLLWPDHGLMLPPGTLASFSAGDVLGLSVQNGMIVSTRVTAPLQPVDIRDKLLTVVGPDDPAAVDAVVWQLMYENPTLFREPMVPLPEVFDAAGLVVNVDHVAREGVYAETEQRAMSDTVDLLITLVDEVTSLPDDDARDRIREAVTTDPAAWSVLGDPYLATVACSISIRLDGGVKALALVAEELASVGPRPVRSAAHWLRARASDLLGDAASAESELQRAVDLDSNFVPARFDSAIFASLRGDAQRGIALLRAVDSDPADELREVLEKFVPKVRTDLGRNDRCWCGSGRKYKVCHLRKSESTLEQRASWLYQKAGNFITDGRGVAQLQSLAAARAIHIGDAEDPVGQALQDPFVVDVLLFEGGLFADFVEQRGSMLPADELNLAQQWLLVERSVHEVESVKPGEGLSLRDIRTGDRQFVSERSASTQLHPGHFICARVVPVRSDLQFFGGIEPVYPTQRADLIALMDSDSASPEDLVDFLSARFEPPQVTTRHGEPVVFCEARIELGELNGVRRKLSRKYGAADGNRWTWTDGPNVLGSLTLEGAELTIEAMSENKFGDLLDAVKAMHPTVNVLSDKHIAAADVLANSSGRPAPREIEHDPEIIALLEERIREHEASWIHESIPALDGYTPTQAAADPTRRDEVVRLIDSFPDTGQPGAMSPRRLRQALGFDDG